MIVHGRCLAVDVRECAHESAPGLNDGRRRHARRRHHRHEHHHLRRRPRRTIARPRRTSNCGSMPRASCPSASAARTPSRIRTSRCPTRRCAWRVRRPIRCPRIGHVRPRHRRAGAGRLCGAPSRPRPRARTARRSVARARGRRGRPAGRAAHLTGLLVGLPRGASACRLPRAGAIDAAAAIDVGVAVDVDVGVTTAAIAAAAPGRADRGAPDDAPGERGTGRIRVVVRRVWSGVVAPVRHPVGDDSRRVVLRHVDHLRIRRLDVDDLLLDPHDLLVVRLEVARALGLATERLHGLDHGALVRDDRLAERGGPVEVVTHLLDDVGIVQQ